MFRFNISHPQAEAKKKKRSSEERDKITVSNLFHFHSSVQTRFKLDQIQIGY